MSGGGAAMSTEAIMNTATAASAGRDLALKIVSAAAAGVGYGGLAAFLYLIGMQLYRWFRAGEWAHFGVTDGLRIVLSNFGVKDGDPGRLAALLHWLDTPVDWLGLHKVLEVAPASLALFALSIVGNSLFIYCRDRLAGGSSPSQR